MSLLKGKVYVQCSCWTARIGGCRKKILDDRFRLDVGREFFTVWVMRHWNRLPRKVVDAPSLEVFKASLDGV